MRKQDIPKKNELLENGLYYELQDIGVTNILFRKFDSGLYIASTDYKGNVSNMLHITKENLDVIMNAPEIKTGDGITPQIIN